MIQKDNSINPSLYVNLKSNFLFSILLKNVMYCNRLFRSFLWTLAYSFLKHVSSALMRLSFDVFFRLRLKFSCMMELSRYPLDRQICDMQIASCKYYSIQELHQLTKSWIKPPFFMCSPPVSKTSRELLLHWDSSDMGSSVTVSSDLKMPQFTIERVVPTLCYERFHLGKKKN